MKYLVDTAALVADGVITPEQAQEIRERAREDTVSFGVSLLMFTGIIAVIGGTAAFLDDPAQFCLLGAVVSVGAALLLMRDNETLTIPTNAAAVVGTVMFTGGGMAWLFPEIDSPVVLILPGALLAALALAGWAKGPAKLRFLMGWMAMLGVAFHLFGLLANEPPVAPPWLLFHYAALLLLVTGVLLDVRLITVLALVPLATALSSQSFYGFASYGISIRESTLTILQMALIIGACLWAAPRITERYERHTRILGQLSFIWMNMAFWIGSLWGDTVGQALWGPSYWDVPEDAPNRWDTYREMQDAFRQTTLHISDDVYTVAWAVLLVAAGIWAAMNMRRKIFNIAITFAAIHLYTQYFERFELTPGAFILAGLVAIGLAWGVWQMNRKMKERETAT